MKKGIWYVLMVVLATTMFWSCSKENDETILSGVFRDREYVLNAPFNNWFDGLNADLYFYKDGSYNTSCIPDKWVDCGPGQTYEGSTFKVVGDYLHLHLKYFDSYEGYSEETNVKIKFKYDGKTLTLIDGKDTFTLIKIAAL
jgi:hypothetical protein